MNRLAVFPSGERACKHKPGSAAPLHRPNLWRTNSDSTDPDAESIHQQVARVLGSPGFLHAARMRCFLQFIVSEALAGRAGALCEYSIATSVFGRSDSFEPGLDPIVRNDARRLRQKLVEYYARQGQPDPVLIEVPKGAYVPCFAWNGRVPPVSAPARYQLSVLLTRVEDGAEVWRTAYDFDHGETLNLQLKAGSEAPLRTAGAGARRGQACTAR